MAERLQVADSFAPTLDRLKRTSPHGLLLHGDDGVGLLTIARDIAEPTARIISPQDIKGVDDPNGTITIDRIRELYEATRGSANHVQTIIIDDSDRMSTGAQNAFLKLLEEPSANTKFVLTSHRDERLLPTIRSRVSAVHVPPISQAQSSRYLQSRQVSTEETSQLLFIASGKPALLHKLVADTAYRSETVQTMRDARTVLSGKTRYERLAAVYPYGQNRAQAITLIQACIKIVEHTLAVQPSTDSISVAERMLATLDGLRSNANPRLQLVHFVLQ